MEITVLHRQGKAIREIARLTGHSRNSVRAVLRGKAKQQYGPRQPRKRKLDPYKDWLRERVASAAPQRIPATVLLCELQAQGYPGGMSQLRAYVKTLQPAAPVEPVLRFETGKGEQMQVDWVVFWRGKEPLSAFVATLGRRSILCARQVRPRAPLGKGRNDCTEYLQRAHGNGRREAEFPQCVQARPVLHHSGLPV